MTSQTVGTIIYNVDVKSQNFLNGMTQVDKSLEKLDGGFARADKSGQAFAGGLNKISQALAGLATIKALEGLQKMSEEFTVLRARIDRFSGGVAEGAANYERLLAISSKTGSDMGTAVKTWESLTGSLKEMGKSNEDVLKVTDTLMKMGVVGGSSAEEMKNGLRQLGQSFAGGIVRGEEFNSVLENTPEIARQIAKGMGIAYGDLRKQMLDSKLTAEVVFEAIQKRAEAINVDFEKMPRTVAQASNAIRNEFGSALAKLDQESGFSKNLAAAIDLVASKIASFGADAESLSTALDLIGNAASSFAAVMAGRVLMSLGATAAAQLVLIRNTLASVGPQAAATASALALARAEFDAALAISRAAQAAAAASVGLQTHAALANAAAIAQERTTVAAMQLSAAMTASASTVTATSLAMNGLKTAMTFLGGPVGVILLAAYALYEFSKASRETKVDVDQLNGSLQKLSFSQLAKASNDAGDDIEKLNKRLSGSMSDLNTASKAFYESDVDFSKRKTALQAEYDGIKQQIEARKQLQQSIKDQQDQITKDQIESQKPQAQQPKAHKTSEPDQKVIDNLKEQAELAKLAGAARARLAAEQKLSSTATAEEKKEVGDLAVKIYELETARKEGKKDAAKAESEASRQRKKDADEEKRHTEENAKSITDYGVAIGMAAMKGEDLAKAQAISKLNKFATPQDVSTMEALGAAMYKVQQIEENKSKLSSVDPMAAEDQRYADELTKLRELNDAKILEDQRYNELKLAAATSHDEQVRALEEAAFIRQSEANRFLMSSIDALGQTTTQVFSGILSGTMSGQQAMQAFASTIFNEAIGALVQMGVQSIKTMIVQKSAQAAAGAAYAAGVAAQVATTTALAGQAAFASTAAIPVVGPAAAPGAALAASSAAASLGAPAVAAAPGVAAGRLYGGDVNAGSMYAVAEDGAPEIFQSDNGKNYMIPGSGGEVISNKNATAGSGMIVNININVDSGGESSVSTSGDGNAEALAEQFRAMTLTVMQDESRQGGILWNMQNERY